MGAWWLPVGAGARLGERRSGRVPGWVSAGRGGCQGGLKCRTGRVSRGGAVVVDEEASSSKTGL